MSKTTFDQLIREVNGGEANSRASDELRELLAKMRHRAADDGESTGTITVTLKLSLARNGAFEMVPTVSSKAPKVPVQKGNAWLSEKDELLFRDPRQGDLKLRDAAAANNVRDLPGAKKNGTE